MKWLLDVDSHHDFFPEMVLIQTPRRLYPKNGTLAHVIGYTGEISEQELDLPEFAKYDPGAVVGKIGIEKQYNDSLMGIDGQRQVIVAEAYRDAQKVKGDGDAKASAIFAEEFGRDPQFAKFYRSLEAYRASFRNKSDVMILDPNNEFFKSMQGSGPTPGRASGK